MNSEHKILVVTGPTASGKTELAVRIAEAVDGEIINADSLQVYRGFDIGSAKPLIAERRGIVHHLIDICGPKDDFTAADFASAADEAVKEIISRGRKAVVVGGTGLYIRALIHGIVSSPKGDPEFRRKMHQMAQTDGRNAVHSLLESVDPEAAAEIHPNNLVRTVRALEVHHLTGKPISSFWHQHGFAVKRYDALQLAVNVPLDILYKRIEDRVELMFASGFADEVENLLRAGCSRGLKPMRTIGYKEIASALDGELSMDEAKLLIKKNTRNYAKRQMTWFRGDSYIKWVEYPVNFDSILSNVIQFFA